MVRAPYVKPALTSVGFGTTAGTSVAADASANTKGTSFTELDAATTDDADGFYLNILVNSQTDMLIDIATGAASSETVIVADIQVSSSQNTTIQEVVEFYIPLPIVAGTRLSARCQASTGSKTCFLAPTLVSGEPYSLMRCVRSDTYGANTADSGGTSVDPGASISTKGGWVQLSASIAADADYVVTLIGNQLNAARTDSNFAVDLGTGANPNEVVLIPNMYARPNSQSDGIRPHEFERWVPKVPSGTRLVARASCGINDATDRLLDVSAITFTREATPI